MSVYLGDQKVGVSQGFNAQLDVGDEVISAEQIENLNDAVNYRTGTFGQKSINQMIAALKEEYQIKINQELRIGEDNALIPWTRPNDWPDLDSLNLAMEGDTDFIYMTYDASKSLGAISLQITGSNISVTTGHINNGEYIIDDTISSSGSNTYTKWLNQNSGYTVVRVMGTITACYLASVTDADGRIQQIKQQPIVERIAYIPHIAYISGGSSSKWASYFLEREKIANGNGNALTNLSYAYDCAYKLKKIELEGLKTQNVTNMTYMFNRCMSLNHSLDLRHFNVEKVTNLNNTFAYCYFVPEMNLTGWVTSALTGSSAMSGTFQNCKSLKYIYGTENFNISNCTSLNSTFIYCTSLQELDLSNWNTSKITTLYQTFYYCYSIKDLNSIKNWNVSNVTSLLNTFNGCYNIEKLDLSNWNVNKVNTVAGCFNNCISLKQLNITGWETDNLTRIDSTFAFCYSLENIDISGWHVTNTCTQIASMFTNCWSLKYLDIPNNWDISGVTGTGNYAANIFNNCYNLKRITGISNWNFQINNGLSNMFYNCYSLEEVDVSGWNVSTITNFSSTFYNCYCLKELDLSNWNTSSCTSFNSMFMGCRSLKSLNLSNFNTSNVTTLYNMFSGCYSLATVGDISNWDTSKVTSIAAMFKYCNSLQQKLDLSSWDVRKVTTVESMFGECFLIKEIILNNWNLTACTNLSGVFGSCILLKKLSTNNWSLPVLTNNTTNLFLYCFCLEDYTGIPIKVNHTYQNSYSLSHDSIISILTALPTVSSKTITFNSQAINQLSAAEKAIATSKGWTIAT